MAQNKVPGQRATVNINVDELNIATCNCGNVYYETLMTYKLIPALMSPNGQEQLLSIPAARCVKCHSIFPMEEIVRLAKGENLVSTLAKPN